MRITFDVPEEILHGLLDGVAIPEMARVRYSIETVPPMDTSRWQSNLRAVASTWPKWSIPWPTTEVASGC